MAGPTISRGEMYGGDEGAFGASADASGAVQSGPPPALFWLAALGILIVIRLVWESSE